MQMEDRMYQNDLALDVLMETARGARPLPAGVWILLALTSRPMTPADRERLQTSLARGMMSQLLHFGWSVRLMSARNFLVWRNGRLLARSDLALLVLPAWVPPYTPEEWTHICLFEGVRRLHRVGLAASGREQKDENADERVFACARDYLRVEEVGRLRSPEEMDAAIQRSVFAGYALD
jgi:hypothetical protein